MAIISEEIVLQSSPKPPCKAFSVMVLDSVEQSAAIINRVRLRGQWKRCKQVDGTWSQCK